MGRRTKPQPSYPYSFATPQLYVRISRSIRLKLSAIWEGNEERQECYKFQPSTQGEMDQELAWTFSLSNCFKSKRRAYEIVSDGWTFKLFVRFTEFISVRQMSLCLDFFSTFLLPHSMQWAPFYGSSSNVLWCFLAIASPLNVIQAGWRSGNT